MSTLPPPLLWPTTWSKKYVEVGNEDICLGPACSESKIAVVAASDYTQIVNQSDNPNNEQPVHGSRR